MSNPLEPGNRRNNWLEKEEFDTSQFLETMQAMIDDAERQIEVLRQNYKPDGKWYYPYPLDSSDLDLDEDFDEDPNQPFADESDAEYFRRMDLKRMGQ